MSFKKYDVKLAMQEAQNKKMELFYKLMKNMRDLDKRLEESLETLVGEDIIKDIKVQFIPDQREFNRFNMILIPIKGYASHKLAHIYLMKVTDWMEDIIDPQYPFDFKPQVWRVKECLHEYRKALRWCIGMNAQKWDEGQFKVAMEMIGGIKLAEREPK